MKLFLTVLTFGCLSVSAFANPGVVDQRSSDITVLRAEVTGTTVTGREFNSQSCLRPDGVVDCTWKFEQLANAPAIHDAFPQNEQYSSYYCHIARIVTASRKGAIQSAAAVGFYVGGGQGRLIPVNHLKKVGEATFKNGEPAELHEFAMTAVCWQGSGSSSMYATYRFRPFLRFVTPNAVYHNWDAVPSDYVLSATVHQFDRSAELLR